jgi:ABC-type transporter Mla maintaining outer membrane lipid asymmetry ATPase subunit MlaF
MNQTEYYLELENVSYKRDTLVLLNNISFKVSQGEFLTIGSGDISGKSSLLKLCAGLIQPDNGVIKINGNPLAGFSYDESQKLRYKTGFVFQDGTLVSNLSIKENIALPLRYHLSLNETEIEKYATKYIELLSLTSYADKRPAGLPDGIKLLTCLARALVVEPELLLLDELFSSLDKAEIQTVITLLKEIKKKRGMTCIATTKVVNILSYFPEAQVTDCLMILESGKTTEYGICQTVRQKLLQERR